jgi:hypothetical protein
MLGRRRQQNLTSPSQDPSEWEIEIIIDIDNDSDRTGYQAQREQPAQGPPAQPGEAPNPEDGSRTEAPGEGLPDRRRHQSQRDRDNVIEIDLSEFARDPRIRLDVYQQGGPRDRRYRDRRRQGGPQDEPEVVWPRVCVP